MKSWRRSALDKEAHTHKSLGKFRAWYAVPEANKPFIGPNEDYKDVLSRLKKDFLMKYENDKPSPDTNLRGYDEIVTLGSGAFGKVKLVKHRESGKYYAVKTMLKSTIVKNRKVHHILSEKRILQAVSFPTLVSFEFSSKDNDYLYLGLQVVNGGELFTYHRKVKKFNEKQARFYAAQILLAFEYLHHLSVLYRDLKLENILIDINGYIKLTDFGFAKKVEDRTTTLCGTPEYLAPEIIQSQPYGSSADWWSFGVFLFELVAGYTPFYQPHTDVMTMYNKICSGEYRIPSYFSIGLTDLVDKMLQVDVTKRLGCQVNGCFEIRRHPWFRSIDWNAMLNQEINAPYVPNVTSFEDTSHFRTEQKRPVLKSDQNWYEHVFVEF